MAGASIVIEFHINFIIRIWVPAWNVLTSKINIVLILKNITKIITFFIVQVIIELLQKSFLVTFIYKFWFLFGGIIEM